MEAKKQNNIGDFIINNAILIIILILTIIAAIVNKNFISFANLKNIGINSSTRFMIALGVSGCLITRGTDLSAGRIIGLGACVAGTFLQTSDYSNKFFPNLGDVNIFLVLLLTIAICALFGFLNGVVISKLKVPPFIATLGMQTIVYGLVMLYTGSIPLGNFRKDYTKIASTNVINIPVFIIMAAIISGLMWFLYNKTKQGKYMYAVGGNEQAAEVSGVKVSRTVIIIYTFAACLYAFAGFLIGAKAGGANVNTGSGYELEAIASCTIGGVSTTGGVGKISGILIGVLVFEVLKTALQYLGIDPAYHFIVQGFVIITAVAIDVRKYLAKN